MRTELEAALAEASLSLGILTVAQVFLKDVAEGQSLKDLATSSLTSLAAHPFIIIPPAMQAMLEAAKAAPAAVAAS